jgi:hypothetical protein
MQVANIAAYSATYWLGQYQVRRIAAAAAAAATATAQVSIQNSGGTLLPVLFVRKGINAAAASH